MLVFFFPPSSIPGPCRFSVWLLFTRHRFYFIFIVSRNPFLVKFWITDSAIAQYTSHSVSAPSKQLPMFYPCRPTELFVHAFWAFHVSTGYSVSIGPDFPSLFKAIWNAFSETLFGHMQEFLYRLGKRILLMYTWTNFITLNIYYT